MQVSSPVAYSKDAQPRTSKANGGYAAGQCTQLTCPESDKNE